MREKTDASGRFVMTRLPESGRPCTATRKDGSPCRHKAINGLPEQVCSVHAKLMDRGAKGRLSHGFYARGSLEHFDYLRRVRPENFVQDGGLALGRPCPQPIPEPEIDLHPLDPDLADINLTIAGLVRKMAILDALIFRAEEHGLDITLLLSLYLGACGRLGRLVVQRHEMSRSVRDPMARLEGANARLDALAETPGRETHLLGADPWDPAPSPAIRG
jgi:hypothetical protein